VVPFGFTPDDDDLEKNNSGDNSEGASSEDFAAMMRQMQEQIQEQFQKLGINPAGFVNPLAAFTGTQQDALPQSVVRDTAKKFVQAQGSAPIGVNDLKVVQNAFEIADIWLNEATDFPATESSTAPKAVSRLDWVDETIQGWQSTMEPLATGLTTAMSKLLDEAGAQGMGAQMGPITALLRTFIGSLIATQLGQAIGGISSTATGAHDVGLPLLEPARPLLIPENIEKWSAELEIPKSEVYLFHALREAAIARLFAHNPWLVSYMRSAIVEYGRGIRIDLDAIQRQAEEAMQNFDPSQMDPSQFTGGAENSFTIALNNGIFTPEETPAQRAALSKLETALALVDGWADEVATLAAGERLPSISQLREMYRRQRATSAPSQQLFKSLLGLQVTPKLAREASAFWQKIREVKSISARDQIWSSILPTADELLDPEKFVSSTEIPDDLSGLL
jgi:putative hydrolase